MATEEDHKGDSGRVSGSIYSGDHDHYEFLAEAFGAFAHANVLQRDMYPSATKFEGEIIAMTADMLHGDDVHGRPRAHRAAPRASSPRCSPTASGDATRRASSARRSSCPRPAHPALDKACHYFGIEVVKAPVTTDYVVDVDFVRDHIGPTTVALIGTAGTYPHGMIDPIESWASWRSSTASACTSTAASAGSSSPWARRARLRHPRASTSASRVSPPISADTHKYGYGLKGSSVAAVPAEGVAPPAIPRHRRMAGRQYASPSMGGSRSGGLIAATWACMLSFGKAGYRSIAADIFRTAAEIKAAVRASARSCR